MSFSSVLVSIIGEMAAKSTLTSQSMSLSFRYNYTLSIEIEYHILFIGGRSTKRQEKLSGILASIKPRTTMVHSTWSARNKNGNTFANSTR